MNHLQEQFDAFHRDNPAVWVEFERIALGLMKNGRENYSADAILHVMRFHRDMETKGAGEVDGRPLKLNDHFSAFYARMFNRKYQVEFFRLRHASHDREIVGCKPRHNVEVNA